MTDGASNGQWEVREILGGFVLNFIVGGQVRGNGPAYLVPPSGTDEDARREAEKEAARRNAGLPA